MMCRRALVLLFGALVALSLPALAQSSAADFIAGEVIKVDAERAEVTLRHEPISHLHLPARTTMLHYVDARLIVRIKAGDKIRFRADRFEGTLRLTAVLLPGMGLPVPPQPARRQS